MDARFIFSDSIFNKRACEDNEWEFYLWEWNHFLLIKCCSQPITLACLCLHFLLLFCSFSFAFHCSMLTCVNEANLFNTSRHIPDSIGLIKKHREIVYLIINRFFRSSDIYESLPFFFQGCSIALLPATSFFIWFFKAMRWFPFPERKRRDRW
jgi:hypothetical protein